MNTYGLREAATIARVHYQTLRKMAALGQAPATKIGRAWVFPCHLFDSWIENKCLSTSEKDRPTGGAKVQSLAERIEKRRAQKIAKMQRNSRSANETDCGDSTS